MMRIKLFELICIVLLPLITTFVGVEMLQIEENPEQSLELLAETLGIIDPTGVATKITSLLTDMISGEGGNENAKLDLIISKIDNLSGKLDTVENHLSNQINNMRLILTKKLRQSHVLDDTLRDLSALINSIHQIYEDYLTYSNNKTEKSKPSDHSILEFTQSMVSSNPGHLRDKLQKISALVSPNKSKLLKDFLNLLAEDTKSSANEACGAPLSAQQQLYGIYLMLILIEKESLDVIDYADTQLTRLTNVSYDWDLKTANEKTNKRINSYFLYLSDAVRKAPRDIRPCDPEKHERKVTFIEFERLVGLYITNKIDRLTSRGAPCSESCSEGRWGVYGDPENLATRAVTTKNPSRTGWDYSFEDYCHGALTDCWSIVDVEYCQIPGSLRRFEWFKDGNGYTYGDDKTGCPNGFQPYRKRWWQLFQWCDYCVCQCNLLPGAPSGIIFISLMAQVADIDNNKVVTGVRFTMSGKIVMLQIKEGVLHEQGRVMDSQWKPIMDITNQRNLIITQLQDDGSYAQLKRGKHYEALSTNAKIIFLDDIVVPQQYVITGVRIKAEDGFPEGEKAFHLEVLATPFEYLTGKLNTSDENKSLWFSYKLMEMIKSPEYLETRSELTFSNPDNPLKSEINTVDSKPNQFVKFRVSDLKLDAGQTVIPFVDIQPVEATPDVPLSGVGIFHKGAIGYGGFIAPRIFTYDLSSYVKPMAFKAQHLKP